jgi:5-dehydro-2-deoxygluconokinase
MLFAAELARSSGATVLLDIDYRPDQWADQRAFGVTLRSALRLVDIVIGTEDEINAAMLTDPTQISIAHSQISDARVRGDTANAIQALLRLGPRVLVHKRGADGASVHLAGSDAGEIERIDVPGFPVQVQNILGAGDAFAAGLIYGIVHGWNWYQATRMGNASGAILVTKHGCANFMPTYDELMTFVADHGGL